MLKDTTPNFDSSLSRQNTLFSEAKEWFEGQRLLPEADDLQKEQIEDINFDELDSVCVEIIMDFRLALRDDDKQSRMNKLYLLEKLLKEQLEKTSKLKRDNPRAKAYALEIAFLRKRAKLGKINKKEYEKLRKKIDKSYFPKLSPKIRFLDFMHEEVISQIASIKSVDERRNN